MATRKPLFINTDGYPEEMATTDDLVIGGLSSSGDITMTGGAEVLGLPATPGGATYAASKAYVDSIAAGLDVRESCRLATAAALPAYTQAGTGVGATLTATANGALSVDGIAVAASDRILVKNGAANSDNGIYTVTTVGDGSNPYVLTRATDADEDSEVTDGMFCFVGEGATQADTGWVQTTNDPVTVDSSDQTFVQFSAAGSFTGGDGIDITGSVISVDLATVSGLEFATGELRIDVADTNELTIDATGLNVEGVPTLFNIGATAVGATVTAPNLDTLTDGSNADALHVHAGGSSNKVQEDLAVNEAIAIGDAIEWSTTNDRVQKCDAAVDAKVDCFGIATSAQAVVGNNATVVRCGIATGVISGATAGDRYYVANGGGITSTLPVASGDNVILVGTATNATDLEVHIQFIGRRA